jgi:hypothetical protein
LLGRVRSTRRFGRLLFTADTAEPADTAEGSASMIRRIRMIR